MRRSVLLLPAVAAAIVLGLAGCADETAGNATPGDETSAGRPSIPDGTESTEPGEETSSTEPGSGDNPVAELEPCDLVSAEAAAEVGLTGGEAGETGRARDCRYRYEGATVDDSFTVGVAIFDELGLDDVVGSNVKPVPTVGSHDAVTYSPPAGGCAVSMAVGESSRVDTQAIGGDDQKACQLAMQLATLVEPELP